MLSLGALGFAVPWALAALAALPALWWLLRVTPPSPLRIVFPPLALLATLASREEAAARTPWWLMALRLTLAVAVILGIARPVLNAGSALPATGPVYVLVDNGWASAGTWPERAAALDRVLDLAERERLPVVLMPTAPPGPDGSSEQPTAMPASAARKMAQAMVPVPWPTDPSAAATVLTERARAAGWAPGTVIWLSDGLASPADGESITKLLDRLRSLGDMRVMLPRSEKLPLLLAFAEPGPGGLQIDLVRPTAVARPNPSLRLLAEGGSPLSLHPVGFGDGELRAHISLDLPTELAGRLARIEIDGENSAGAVILVDERWQRRAVGLAGDAAGGSQPLLGGRYYLERALQPFAEVRYGPVAQLLERPLAMLVLTDVGSPDPDTAAAIRRWVEDGGVLLRFAGPRLAREPAADDPLLPLPLRPGERTIGGALSWVGTGKLAPFPLSSPFRELKIPPDLRVDRQVIAEPSLDTAERTWASLEDGTPLITGARRGEGWVVLVHTAASPDWSNLPLSGLFVELLRKIAELARTTGSPVATQVLLPLETLDGYGRPSAPPVGTRPISGEDVDTAVPGPLHPPGFYGTAEMRRALNLGPSVRSLSPMGVLPTWVEVGSMEEHAERDLRPWLLSAALLLAAIDLVVSLVVRGVFGRPARRLGGAGGIALALFVLLASPSDSSAQGIVRDASVDPASLTTQLAYVRSGDGRLDDISAAGLAGLSAVVNRRTAAELAEPVGIDPETDELAFYPLLYWPLSDLSRPPSANASRKLAGYMRSGGTIVFDTRGRHDSDRGVLRTLARALDLPPLVPAPEDHVLRRAYYLLTDLPGRRAGGTVWVERPGEHVNDGVSSVIAGSADWAGAWAVDDTQRPLLAVAPGGERQREQAYRFGVNLVMYVLTGNYKADQVHLPTILERLAP